MIQPQGFADGSGRVCVLQKCIYGLNEVERKWNFQLSNLLKTIGFKIYAGLLVQVAVLLLVHVDDILVISKTKHSYGIFRDLLKSEFKMKQLGKPKHILNVPVKFVKNEVLLSRRQCVEEIVCTFSFHKRNKVYTPMQPHLTPGQSVECRNDIFNPHFYRQLIWSWMQLATWTTPDISYALSMLSQFFSNPNRRHRTLDSTFTELLKNPLFS